MPYVWRAKLPHCAIKISPSHPLDASLNSCEEEFFFFDKSGNNMVECVYPVLDTPDCPLNECWCTAGWGGVGERLGGDHNFDDNQPLRKSTQRDTYIQCKHLKVCLLFCAISIRGALKKNGKSWSFGPTGGPPLPKCWSKTKWFFLFFFTF